MTKVRDGLPRRAKAAGLDRLKAALERIVQPRQLGLGHLVVSIRENQIDVSLGQTRRCIARDAAILDVDTDRLHASKPTCPTLRGNIPDGAHVVTASDDHTARVWDA